MKTSDQGLAILIDREAKKNKAYKDTVGVWTIGVGHTGTEVHEGLEWTDQQVMDVLLTLKSAIRPVPMLF